MSDDTLRQTLRDLVRELGEFDFDWNAVSETSLETLMERLPHEDIEIRLGEIRSAIEIDEKRRALAAIVLRALTILGEVGVRLIPVA